MATTLLTLTIPGEPVGKGRPKFARRGAFVTTRTPEKTAAWEAGAATLMSEAWAGRAPLDQPVALTVEAIAGRSKDLLLKSPTNKGGLTRKALEREPHLVERLWRTKKPDGDNVAKAVGDALVKAGVVCDDTRIVDWRIRCLTAAIGEGPSVVVRLDVAPDAPTEAL
jgi:Holliday junction resolvase RusA-like endonuclease